MATLGTPVITVAPFSWIYSPYDPIVFEVTWAGTDNNSVSNQRMKCNVTVNNTTGYGTITKEAVDLSGTLTYRFNISDILKTALTNTFYNNISSDQINSSSTYDIVVDYNCTFTPHYTDSSGADTTDVQIDDGISGYVGQFILPRNFTPRYVSTNEKYLMSVSTDKFLTHSPQNKVIRAGEDEQLSFMYWGANQLEYNYQTYDLGGNANAAQTKSLVTINNKSGHLTISDNGVNTVIDDFTNISKIDVWLEESTGTQISEKRTYLIDQKCPEGYRLWWANSLGGFDKYTFNAFTEEDYKVNKRVNYTNPNDSTPTIEERKQSTLKVIGNHHFEAATNFLTTEWMPFFKDLINSHNVYYQPYIDGAYTTEIHPVLVNTKVLPVNGSDKLIQAFIQFEYSEKEKTMQG